MQLYTYIICKFKTFLYGNKFEKKHLKANPSAVFIPIYKVSYKSYYMYIDVSRM